MKQANLRAVLAAAVVVTPGLSGFGPGFGSGAKGVPTGLAEANVEASVPEPSKVVPWPTATASFQRLAVGNFLADQRTHAFVLADGALSFAYDVSLHSSVTQTPLSSGVCDVVKIVGAPGVDGVLVTGAGLPSLVQVDPLGGFVQFPVLSMQWAGAHGLNVFQDPGDPGLGIPSTTVVAAVDAGETKILLALQDVALTEFLPIDVGLPVSGVHLVDWDGDGVQEVVAMTDGMLRPFELDGTALTAITIPMADAVATRFLDAVGDELLAVAGTRPDGSTVVGLRNLTRSTPWFPIETSLLDPLSTPVTAVARGLIAEDFSGDGVWDLVFSQESHPGVVMMEFTSGVDSFPLALQNVLVPVSSASPLPESCVEVVGDLNGDGSVDMLSGLSAAGELVTSFGIGSILTGVSAAAGILSEVNYTGSHLELVFSAGWLQQSTHVELIVWHQDDPSGGNVPLDPLAEQHKRFSVISGRNNSVYVPLDPVADGMDSLYWPARDHYYISVRTVAIAGASEKVGAYEILAMTIVPDGDSTHGLETNGDVPAGVTYPDYLFDLKDLVGDDPVWVNQTSRPDSLGGVILPRRDPPPFPVNTVPKPGPLVIVGN